jgi:hypothetical protein
MQYPPRAFEYSSATCLSRGPLEAENLLLR